MTTLLLVSCLIALGFLVAVAFYESLCYRDVLVARIMRFARRRSRRAWVHGLAYVLAVGVGIPVLVLVWSQVLELTLVCVSPISRLGNAALLASAIVAAARILAYIRETTAHELAKAIPLSLAALLLTGGAANIGTNLQSIAGREDLIDLTPEMIGFLLAVEIGLRLISDTTRALLERYRRRRGIEVDTGVWRTLWAAIRGLVRPERAGGA
jgi:hypothetical protein